MGKSYKKHGFIHAAGHDGSWKKIFNRRLRRSNKIKDIPNGNAYKKLNCSWNISDWPCIAPSFEEFRSWECNKNLTEKEARDEYERGYKRK